MTTQTQGRTFARELSTNPASDAEREQILANPGFGDHFTDHTAVIDFADGQWSNARVEPYGPIQLDPACAVLHYAQEIFEGLKAYKHADGGIYLFRPEKNAERLQRSARRLALPELPTDLFLESLRQLVEVDQAWVPTRDGDSLYLRPFMFASEKFLGVRPSKEVSYRVIASPAGNYFGGDVKPVSIWLSEQYARAGRGGTGAAKCGGNYAASLLPQMEAQENGCQQVVFLEDGAVQELGGMNVFFIFADGRLVTPELTGTILEGVTRDSILELARDRGLTVEERRISFDEWRDGVASGDITEVFACGTAAVVTPIGELKTADGSIAPAQSAPGEVTMGIREELLGIQHGTREDTRGWLTQVV